MERKIIISGKDDKLYFNILIGGEHIATMRGENFKECEDFYYIKCGEIHQTIEKVNGLVVRDYRITD